MYNIISDIAGNYNTFLELIKKMPKGEVISVGDMIDRGPRSKEVIEWFMQNGRAVLGNHEHMMLDFYKVTNLYESGIWMYNGGSHTLNSFGNSISNKYIDWINQLPLYLKLDGNLISHSFIEFDLDLKTACDFSKLPSYNLNFDKSIIWNRWEPKRRDEYKMQIVGHNSQMGLKTFTDRNGDYTLCLDDCKNKVLTGVHLPTMEIFQQDYIDHL